jgi:hypothetical protein
MISLFLLFYILVFLLIPDDEIKTNEMMVLIDNFREQALKLVDMLDVSIPVVGKLKVRHLTCHC